MIGVGIGVGKEGFKAPMSPRFENRDLRHPHPHQMPLQEVFRKGLPAFSSPKTGRVIHSLGLKIVLVILPNSAGRAYTGVFHP